MSYTRQPCGEWSWKSADYGDALLWRWSLPAWSAHGFDPPRQGKWWTHKLHNCQVVLKAALKTRGVSKWEEETGAVGFISQKKCRVPASTSMGSSALIHHKPNENLWWSSLFLRLHITTSFDSSLLPCESATEPWERCLPREAVGTPSSKTLKVRADGAVSTWWGCVCPCSLKGIWTRRPLWVPSNSNDSMTLW